MINYPNGISFDINQPEHLKTVIEYSQRYAITGGHNANAFNAIVKEKGIRIVSQTPTGVPGITRIEYKIPALHPQTKEITHYKGDGSKPFKKTVYDPKIISDEKILELGQQAAMKGYAEALKSEKGQVSVIIDGIKFRIYLDKTTGRVKNFHPE